MLTPGNKVWLRCTQRGISTKTLASPIWGLATFRNRYVSYSRNPNSVYYRRLAAILTCIGLLGGLFVLGGDGYPAPPSPGLDLTPPALMGRRRALCGEDVDGGHRTRRRVI